MAWGFTLTDYSRQLQIDTPENVLLDADVAGFGTRCVAAVIDYLILGGVALVTGLIYFRSGEANSTSIAVFILFQFVLITFYHLFFEFLWNGQTPGKRRFNLRVVQVDGLPLTTNSAIIRNIIRLFDFLPIFYGFGLISLFATRNTQRLGDLAAGTMVIRERPQLTVATVKENWFVRYQHISRREPLPPYIDIAQLTEDDRRDVVGYLRRRDDLLNRGQIAGLLAVRLGEKYPAGTIPVDLRLPVRAETFLEQIARAFEVNESVE
jgi:uncharacterized RDD family membrane protein YckC